ncbi:MAG: hypothetical protein ABI634_14130 [Acidobacteriota bacterium]
MTEDRDEILDELRELMAVEPTPGFEARVRNEVTRRAVRPTRPWWLAAAATCAVLVAIVATRMQPPSESARRSTKTAPIASPATPAPGVSEKPAITPVRVRLGRIAVKALPQRVEPEVLVPPDQAIALRKLMVAVREGRVVLAPVGNTDAPVVVEPLPEISPVKVEELPGASGDLKPGTESKKVGDHVPTEA